MNKIDNKIIRTTEMNYLKELKVIKSNSKVFLLELDGLEIKEWYDYIEIVEKAFQFPTSCLNSIDCYLDWLRDLSWLDYDAFIILIKHSEKFLENQQQLKKQILDDFQEVVMPFWQSEVKEVVVGGKTKIFNVYLI